MGLAAVVADRSLEAVECSSSVCRTNIGLAIDRLREGECYTTREGRRSY